MPITNPGHSIAKLSKEKGNLAFEAKDYGTARSLYSHAMAYDQSNHLYPLNRCLANLKLGRWDDAEADATNVLNMYPRNLKALFRRGKACKELGKWDQARVDIQMYIDNGGDPKLGSQELKVIADAESSLPSNRSSYISSGLDSGLENLHIQDNSPALVIRSSTTVQNGEGAFASRGFRRGQLILSERPIFRNPTDIPEMFKCIFIEAAVRTLAPASLNAYLSLQNSHAECACFPSHPLLAIFSTNAFGIIGDKAGIWLKASKFNHSCSPNAEVSSNLKTGELRIYALRTILPAEEIFLAYVNDGCLYGESRQSRQSVLLTRYHFTCACSVCSLPEAESKMSDAKRLELWERRIRCGVSWTAPRRELFY